jgi:hypothetical protein
MKTTIDISDPLLREARSVAARDGTTLRALVEKGLRQVVAEKKRKSPYRLRQVTFGGRGLTAEFRQAEWRTLRDLAHEGRGG